MSFSINFDLLIDQIFDVPSVVEKLTVEAIGQAVDTAVFNTGTEYTSSITSGGVAAVTTSGTVATAAAITYDNLLAMAYGVELERGVNPAWYMPMGALRSCQALVDNNGRPLFQPVPITGGVAGTLLGYNIFIVPALDNTPDDGAIRMAFCDMSHYWIIMNGGINFTKAVDGQFLEDVSLYKAWIRSDGQVTASTAFAIMKRVDA